MKEPWECHTSADCAKLDKCKELGEGRGCSCVDSTCESQCATKVRRRRVRVMPSYSAGKLVFKRALDIVNFFLFSSILKEDCEKAGHGCKDEECYQCK